MTDKFSHCIGVFIGVFMLVFPLSCYHSITLTNCFLGIYLLKMSCEKCRKWHFRDPKFKNCLRGSLGVGEYAPRQAHLVWSSTSCNFSFCAYTFNFSRYTHEPEHYKIGHKSLIFRTKFLSDFFAARSISKI